MKQGIPPLLGTYSGDTFWTIKSYLHAKPYVLVKLNALKGTNTRRNSEGWEKYDYFYDLSILFEYRTILDPEYDKFLNLLVNKKISPETLNSLYNNGLIKAYYEEYDVLIDWY